MLRNLNDGSSLYVFKYGALGDVVRTAYVVTELAKAKNLNISWVTTPESMPLLRFNPYITSVVDKSNFLPTDCDAVLSLDDEIDSIRKANSMNSKLYFGARLNSENIQYTDASSLWNDMGLLSKFGKQQADKLKRENNSGYNEIFARMLGLDNVSPIFYGNKLRELVYKNKYEKYDFVVGLNPYAGKRWPNKEIRTSELKALISDLHATLNKFFDRYLIILYADDQNYRRASVCLELVDNFIIENTSFSVLDFAASIKHCDLFITADTLGMHLSISQNVPTVAFFTATSAAEIDTNPHLRKICSLSDDYCSYSPCADNSSITSSRIMEQVQTLITFEKR